MTDRLYYQDSYLLEFESKVIWHSEDRTEVELERSAFYPASGGQPSDRGVLAGRQVVDVREQEDRVIHVLAGPLAEGLEVVQGRVDWTRRADHMRQHTGQHFLSAVMEEDFGFKTVSFHMGADYSTIDVEPAAVELSRLIEIEARVNERVLENRRVSISYEQNSRELNLRKPSDREGILRVITIDGVDRSACGGTHVSSTGEIGLIVLGKTEKIRKSLRIEFFCATRAIRFLRARAADAEKQAEMLKERLVESDKMKRKLIDEQASFEGRRKFQESTLDLFGRRLLVEDLDELGEDSKSLANAYLEGPGAIIVLTCSKTGAILFGAHESLQVDCGSVLRSVLQTLGGKGGGSARIAQGSVSDRLRLPSAVEALLDQARPDFEIR